MQIFVYLQLANLVVGISVTEKTKALQKLAKIEQIDGHTNDVIRTVRNSKYYRLEHIGR